ncbi:hypothetical protein KFK09_019831 [Dendrobium nobile]|uniref:Transposase-associated domain-containing protein n=1 Tax=Dendrobium nobile TaxID=94219 RepID=A0A8T3AR85_DENNO|nr:hypothetical protein KFK09_019831 [Dendrobium nobile]
MVRPRRGGFGDAATTGSAMLQQRRHGRHVAAGDLETHFSLNMDKSWITKAKWSRDYVNGVNNFVEFASRSKNLSGKILCPCKLCINRYFHSMKDVKDHLISKGFFPGYVVWNRHGEEHCIIGEYAMNEASKGIPKLNEGKAPSEDIRTDDIDGLLRDILCPNDPVQNPAMEHNEFNTNKENDHSENFANLMQDVGAELYPGCKTFSKLSFILKLFRLKCLHSWTARSFDMLLELLVDAFPKGVLLPKSTYEVKKIMKAFDLGYTKIDACPNDLVSSTSLDSSIPGHIRHWILQSLGVKLRNHKTNLKAEHWDCCPIEEIMESIPAGVDATQWCHLVIQWSQPKDKTIKDRLLLWRVNRLRKDGTWSSEDANQRWIQACELLAKDGLTPEDGNAEANERVFSKVMGPEHPGRVRTQGFGVTPTRYFPYNTNHGTSSSGSNLIQIVNLKEEVDSLRTEMRQFMQEIRMQHPPQGSSQMMKQMVEIYIKLAELDTKKEVDYFDILCFGSPESLLASLSLTIAHLELLVVPPLGMDNLGFVWDRFFIAF